MRKFQDLTIWQRSHSITLKIYQVTDLFPGKEVYGITAQMRRSSSSIATNIAEGCGRNSNAEMKELLTISAGSASELEYQLILSKDLGYLSEAIFNEITNELVEVRKIIYSFQRNMK